MASAERLPPIARPPSTRTASAMSRTVSASSSVSHMDLQIKHHWNDAVLPSSLISRSASPMPLVSDAQLQETVDIIKNAPSSLTVAQKQAHYARLSSLDLAALSQECKLDLYTALNHGTREARRKGMVEFIRNNDGVIRWAASLRSLAESTLDATS